jgi:DNA-binding CsgD family transcriptional regulator
MATGVRLTAEQIAQIVALAADPLLTYAEIGRRVGCSRRAVCSHLPEKRSRADTVAARRHRERMAINMAREGCTGQRIAAVLGVEVSTVVRYLETAGLSLRAGADHRPVPASARPQQPAGVANEAYLARLEQAAHLVAEGLDDAAIAARFGCSEATAAMYRRAAAGVAQQTPADWRKLPRRKLPANHPAFWPTMPLKPGHCYPDIVLPARVAREDARRVDWRARRADVLSGFGSPAAACLEG